MLSTYLRPVLLALLLSPFPAFGAEVIGLLPVTGANVDPGTLEAARDVLRGHLEATGRQVRLAAGDPVREPTPPEAAAAAQAVGASRAAVLRLSRLGSVLRARLAVYEVPGGRQLHFDDMPAGSPNDIDPVLQRLAQGYAAGSRAAAVAEIDTVTDKEASPLNRIPASKGFGLRLGGITPIVPGGSESGTGGGFFWQYDARTYFVDVSFDGFWGRHYHDVSTGFGAYLPLLRGNMTPYLGAGLRYGWARFEGDWSSGLQPQASFGLMLGRLTTVQIRAEVTWFYATFKTAERNANGFLWTAGVVF
jgi:hypothetical protein